MSTTDTSPRFAGLTFDQWATLAAQLPKGAYEPTYEGALRMRLDWLASEHIIDIRARDKDFAHQLFNNVQAKRALQFPQREAQNT